MGIAMYRLLIVDDEANTDRDLECCPGRKMRLRLWGF